MRAPSMRGIRLVAAATRSISSPPKIRSVADAASHGLGGPPPAKQRMDLASTPNVLITSSGLNSAQAIRDLTAAVYDAGGSIAASKKVVLGSHYSLLMALWLPEATPASAAATLSKTLEAHVAGGASLSVVPLESAGGGAEDATVTRRLKIECPQKPGIVLTVTQLLQDHGAVTSQMEAGTSAREGAIWFEIECLVELPESVVEEVGAQLAFWSDSAGAKLLFDASPFRAPLAAA